MSEQTTRVAANKAIALQFVTTYSTLDADAALELMTPDASFVMFGNHAVLDADGLRQHLVKAREIISRSHGHEILEVVGEGDTVVLHTLFRATAANGRDYESGYMWLVKITDGKVSYVCEYANLLAAIEAFGADRVGEPDHLGQAEH